ncbi:MAG TPA: CBS domain-containing protein [Hadesarchaea archaeon]|nr:CBS domain-containing protein [Hadesarchaea archaeon]
MGCRDVLARTSVKEVMRPCFPFVSSRDLVTHARALMRSNGLRTLPVVDGGRLEGILTSREIMRLTSTRSNLLVRGIMLPIQFMATSVDSLLDLSREMIRVEASDVPVVQNRVDRTLIEMVGFGDILRKLRGPVRLTLPGREIMTRNVITCTPEDEIPVVWDAMENTTCSGLPVVRFNKRKHRRDVTGMITRSDIIRSGVTRLEEESDKGRFRSPPRVKSLMRTPAITATPDMFVSEAIEAMLDRDIDRLPVLSRNGLIGIVSRSDVIRVVCGE